MEGSRGNQAIKWCLLDNGIKTSDFKNNLQPNRVRRRAECVPGTLSFFSNISMFLARHALQYNHSFYLPWMQGWVVIFEHFPLGVGLGHFWSTGGAGPSGRLQILWGAEDFYEFDNNVIEKFLKIEEIFHSICPFYVS